jgi:hypothetical protein
MRTFPRAAALLIAATLLPLADCGGHAVGSSDAATNDGGAGDSSAPEDSPMDAPLMMGDVGTIPEDSGLPSSCTGDVYCVLSKGCGSCPDGQGYAICSDGTFSVCDCDIPSGYTEMSNCN